MTILYEARRKALEAEAHVLDSEEENALVDRLAAAVSAARSEQKSEESFRIQVVAELLAKVSDRRATRLLVSLLAEGEAAVRSVVVGCLERLLRSGRTAEVAWAVEEVLAQGLPGPGASQLPALLIQASPEEHPPPIDLLVQLLEHEDAEVTAEAACALSTVDAPGVRELLSSFLDDQRALLSGPDEPQRVGELVRDLLEVIDLEKALPPEGLPSA